MLRRLLVLSTLCLWGCPDKEKVVVVYAVADVRGTVEPCGCTSDPLGGVDHVAALVKGEARPHALVGAGPLLRDPAAPAGAEADAKAQLLERVFGQLGLLKPGVHEVGGVKIGVVQGLERPAGVDLAIALLAEPRAEARRALRGAHGIDLAIVGQKIDLGEPTPEKIGEAWLFSPADQLQKVVRIELHWPPGATRPIVYAGGPGEIERMDERIGSLGKQLAEWRRAPDADPEFLAAREKELSDLRAQRAEKAKSGGVAKPASGAWFTSALVPIKQKLPSDPAVNAEMHRLYTRVGEENRKLDCQKPRPAPEQPQYVGMASCGEAGCHPQAVAKWKTTVHAQAWKSLLVDGRAYSHECFGCHVTGANEPAHGGATLCKPDALVDVQCEVCHGPASLHVKAGGIEDQPTLVKKPADDFCATRCHTPQHSDTFQLVPYLRDILGGGHADKRRAELGEGPTGHELRQAALRKAGRAP